jgi:hypothetical protein
MYIYTVESLYFYDKSIIEAVTQIRLMLYVYQFSEFWLITNMIYCFDSFYPNNYLF